MFQNEIARGMSWLDHVRPNWMDNIDLDTFDVGSCTLCVLGQAFGCDERAKEFMFTGGFGYAKTRFRLTDRELQSMGFQLDPSQYSDLDHGYSVLTAEWKETIVLRREESKLTLTESFTESNERELAVAS